MDAATGAGEKVGAGEAARQIARTAARLFAQRGYDATSVRMIVEAAGVTKPTLYYHFGSKEGLAEALMDRPLGELVETLVRVSESAGDPEAVLGGLVEAHFAFCREEPDRARFYYAVCFGPLASGLAETLTRTAGRLDRPMAAGIARLVAAGAVAPGRADDLLSACRAMITSAVMGFLYQGKECGGRQDLSPALAGRLVGDLLRGFGTGRPWDPVVS